MFEKIKENRKNRYCCAFCILRDFPPVRGVTAAVNIICWVNVERQSIFVNENCVRSSCEELNDR